jgi:hypothetical protein
VAFASGGLHEVVHAAGFDAFPIEPRRPALTPDDVAGGVRALLDPSYRRAAEKLRDEIAALPGPDHAIARLVTSASEGRSSRAGRPPSC